MERLILFDIDGTLVSCGRQVGEIFVGAMRETFGHEHFQSIPQGLSFAGKTDPMIITEWLALIELEFDDAPERLRAMHDLYIENLACQLDASRIRVLPGVLDLLERLEQRDDVCLGLLTGNWHAGAMTKLASVGLDRFFAFGAFGGDAVDRRGLVSVALERAAHHSRTFAVDEVLIVGDTELDIDCAQASGVPCLAVATGFVDAERLRSAGADWVFDDLVQASREFQLFAP